MRKSGARIGTIKNFQAAPIQLAPEGARAACFAAAAGGTARASAGRRTAAASARRSATAASVSVWPAVSRHSSSSVGMDAEA